MIDGRDEAREGEWIFETSDDRPFIPNSIEIDTDRNCLEMRALDRFKCTMCGLRKNRAVFCESEGS